MDDTATAVSGLPFKGTVPARRPRYATAARRSLAVTPLTLPAPLPRSPLLASRAENPAGDKPEKELPSYMRGTAASKNAREDRAKAHTKKMTATTGVESRKQNGRV